jgi:hypothetical protein
MRTELIEKFAKYIFKQRNNAFYAVLTRRVVE